MLSLFFFSFLVAFLLTNGHILQHSACSYLFISFHLHLLSPCLSLHKSCVFHSRYLLNDETLYTRSCGMTQCAETQNRTWELSHGACFILLAQVQYLGLAESAAMYGCMQMSVVPFRRFKFCSAIFGELPFPASTHPHHTQAR